jgi:hypothetical protein
VAVAAARALAGIGAEPERTAEAVGSWLDPAGTDRCRTALAVLSRAAEAAGPACPALTAFVEKYEDRRPPEIYEAIWLLGQIGSGAACAIPVLRECAASPHAAMQGAAEAALRRILQCRSGERR